MTTMQSHQRYFPLGGNRFAFVANGGDPTSCAPATSSCSRGGSRTPSSPSRATSRSGSTGWPKRIESITFFTGGGTFADKAERLAELVRELGGDDAAEAARLAKADQAAELVREFSELEGHIGATYARLAGYGDDVVQAIDEQYLPDSAGGRSRRRPVRSLAAADKLDTLALRSGSATVQPAHATRSACAARRSGSAGSRPRAA